MRRSYKVVDVFTDRPLLGNPVAVVLDAEGLDARAMQAVARWTNLSETTFALPPTTPDADYRLRIFTPQSELPFAGHPTLGSAHALLEAGRLRPRSDGRLVQECGVGLVQVRLDDTNPPAPPQLSLQLPEATVSSLASTDVDELESLLGHPVVRQIPPAIVNVGPVWIVAQLATAEALLAITPDLARCAALERRLGVTGVTLYAPHDPAVGGPIEVRSFAPSAGVEEDPVCGSGNGSVAVFRRDRGLLPRSDISYVATQGRCVGRQGRVAVTVDADGTVQIGGGCVTCVDGVLVC